MRWAAAVALLVTGTRVHAGEPARSKTATYNSPSVGRTLTYRVDLPDDYESSGLRYPVLYLLHGLGGSEASWDSIRPTGDVGRIPWIVVMPDAGNSWYVNWARSEEGRKNSWEDAIVKDLIGHIDATYRTIARREGRAIDGMSMGGYGSMMLGLKHPDLFLSVSSHGGAIAQARLSSDAMRKSGGPAYQPAASPRTSDAAAPPGDFHSPGERTPRGTMWATAEDCDAFDPFQLVLKVPREKLPHIYLDCGSDDRQYIWASQDFMKLLSEKRIPFIYAESPGGHDEGFWRRAILRSMPIQYEILRVALKDVAGVEGQGKLP
jgi:S-formylglutathione hydrolase FrmB